MAGIVDRIGVEVQAIDRFSGPAASIAGATGNLQGAFGGLQGAINGISGAGDVFAGAIGGAGSAIGGVTGAVGMLAGAIPEIGPIAGMAFGMLGSAASFAGRAVEGVIRGVVGIARRLASMGLALAARGFAILKGAVASLTNAIKSLIPNLSMIGAIGAGGLVLFARAAALASMELEAYRAKLEVALKSSEAASEMFAWAKEFAVKTPFEMHGVVDAVTRLEMYGLAAKHWLPMVGDMAGAMGRDVTDAVEAIADAISGGGLERLKEFGISTNVLKQAGWSGTYIANESAALEKQAKAQQKIADMAEKLALVREMAARKVADAEARVNSAKTVEAQERAVLLLNRAYEDTARAVSEAEDALARASAEAQKLEHAQPGKTIKEALEAVLSSRFGGGMEKMMTTTRGAISNLQDAFFNIKAAVGDMLAPALKRVVAILTDMGTKLATTLRGVVGPVASFLSGVTEKLLSAIETNVPAIKQRLGDLLSSIKAKFEGWLTGQGGWTGLWEKLKTSALTVWESITGRLIPAVQYFASQFVSALNQLTGGKLTLQSVGGWLAGLVDSLSYVIAWVGSHLPDLANTIGMAWDWIREKTGVFMSWLDSRGGISGLWDSFVVGIGEIVGTVRYYLIPAVLDLWDAMKKALENAFGGAMGSAGSLGIHGIAAVIVEIAFALEFLAGILPRLGNDLNTFVITPMANLSVILEGMVSSIERISKTPWGEKVLNWGASQLPQEGGATAGGAAAPNAFDQMSNALRQRMASQGGRLEVQVSAAPGTVIRETRQHQWRQQLTYQH